MALVKTFQRIACNSALTSSAVFSRHVAHINSTASHTHAAAQEVKPYEDIPGPRGIYNWPVIGPMFHFKPFTNREATTVHLLFNDLFDKYGPIFKLYMGEDFVMVFEPKDIETVFRNEGRYPVRKSVSLNDVYNNRNNFKPGILDLEGKEWQALRAPLNKKLMKVDSARYYLKPHNVIADDFVEILATQKMSPDAIAEIFFRYAVECISVVCFNTRLGFLEPKGMENKESARLLQATQDVFVYTHMSFTDIAHMWFRNKLYRDYEENKLLLRKQTLKYIKDAQLVLETRKRNGTLDPDEPNLLLYLLSDSSLDFMDIFGIMDSFYTAGTDSTAKNLQTFFYNLAKNPNKQEKLRTEIVSVLGHDGPVTAESLTKIPYLKACLKESLRWIFCLI